MDSIIVGTPAPWNDYAVTIDWAREQAKETVGVVVASRSSIGFWQPYSIASRDGVPAEVEQLCAVVERWARKSGLPLCCVPHLDRDPDEGFFLTMLVGARIASSTGGTVAIDRASVELAVEGIRGLPAAFWQELWRDGRAWESAPRNPLEKPLDSSVVVRVCAAGPGRLSVNSKDRKLQTVARWKSGELELRTALSKSAALELKVPGRARAPAPGKPSASRPAPSRRR